MGRLFNVLQSNLEKNLLVLMGAFSLAGINAQTFPEPQYITEDIQKEVREADILKVQIRDAIYAIDAHCAAKRYGLAYIAISEFKEKMCAHYNKNNNNQKALRLFYNLKLEDHNFIRKMQEFEKESGQGIDMLGEQLSPRLRNTKSKNIAFNFDITRSPYHKELANYISSDKYEEFKQMHTELSRQHRNYLNAAKNLGEKDEETIEQLETYRDLCADLIDMYATFSPQEQKGKDIVDLYTAHTYLLLNQISDARNSLKSIIKRGFSVESMVARYIYKNNPLTDHINLKYNMIVKNYRTQNSTQKDKLLLDHDKLLFDTYFGKLFEENTDEETQQDVWSKYGIEKRGLYPITYEYLRDELTIDETELLFASNNIAHLLPFDKYDKSFKNLMYSANSDPSLYNLVQEYNDICSMLDLQPYSKKMIEDLYNKHETFYPVIADKNQHSEQLIYASPYIENSFKQAIINEADAKKYQTSQELLEGLDKISDENNYTLLSFKQLLYEHSADYHKQKAQNSSIEEGTASLVKHYTFQEKIYNMIKARYILMNNLYNSNNYNSKGYKGRVSKSEVDKMYKELQDQSRSLEIYRINNFSTRNK